MSSLFAYSLYISVLNFGGLVVYYHPSTHGGGAKDVQDAEVDGKGSAFAQVLASDPRNLPGHWSRFHRGMWMTIYFRRSSPLA